MHASTLGKRKREADADPAESRATLPVAEGGVGEGDPEQESLGWFALLPEELLVTVVEMLPFEHALSLRAACRAFFRITNDRDVMKHWYSDRSGLSDETLALIESSPGFEGWPHFLRRMLKLEDDCTRQRHIEGYATKERGSWMASMGCVLKTGVEGSYLVFSQTCPLRLVYTVDLIESTCTCPCNFRCKHIFACRRAKNKMDT